MNIRNHKFKLVKKIRPKNILILLISILFGSCQNNTEQKIIAQQGIFDLTNINIEKGNIKLDGEWEFYWKKLYSPKDFQENKLIPDTFVNCPSDWNNYLINGEKLTGKGFATYKLTVKTSPDNKRFAIKTTYQSTAFNLFVNGELFIENGVVSDNSKNMRAQYLPSVAIFETNHIENEIIIQISNNHHQKGGFRAPILFGTKTNILKQRDKSVTKDAFIAGLLLIMSIFAFGLFIFRSNDKISLIFSVFTFVFFIRTIVTGECLLIYFFPTISWKLQYLLEYISWFSMITIAVIYISYFFPKYSNKIITNVFIFITVAFSLIAIIGNSYITSKLITPQAVVIIIALAYILIMFFRSLKKSKESFLMLIGILIIALTGLNDILSFMDILNTPYFLPAGIIIFIITQALALSVHVFKTEKEKIQIEKQKHIIENKNRQLNIVKEKLEEHEQQLQKRVKELNGLFSLGLLTEKHEKLIDIYTEFTNKIVPESMQFPDKVYVLLEIDDQKYSNIKDYFLPKNKKCLTAKINLFKKQNGNLIVSYTDNLPFLENFEQELINAYAERISEITERTKTKKALKDSEMRWQFAVDGSELGLWDWSIPDNYVFFSKQWKRMIGYNNDEILDFSEEWSNRIHPDDKDKVFADVNKHIDGKVPFYTNEHRLKCKDGTYKWVLSKGIIISWTNDKKPKRMIGTHSDIHEQKLAKEELIKLNATKDKFFSIIAHDLKSPFNSLLGFSKLLLKNHKEYDEERRNKVIKLINDSANSAFKLLENLLTWSRSQSDGIEYLPQKLHLKILLSETISGIKGQIDKKNIRILDTVSENELIYGDKDMIATVLRNLISNAIKYTHPNGEIKINAKQNKNNVTVSITDTGVGINSKNLQKIFCISEKISTPGTENETGTGLGLILCKEFIEKHNGNIWVESEIGKGSTFSFTLSCKN